MMRETLLAGLHNDKILNGEQKSALEKYTNDELANRYGRKNFYNQYLKNHTFRSVYTELTAVYTDYLLGVDVVSPVYDVHRFIQLIGDGKLSTTMENIYPKIYFHVYTGEKALNIKILALKVQLLAAEVSRWLLWK